MVRRILIPTLVAAAFSVPVFLRFYVWSDDSSSDHATHLGYVREGKIPTYPFFHLAVQSLAGGQNDRLRTSAAAVLALATTAAAGLSAAYLASRTRASAFTLTVVCLGLALAMPLPTPRHVEHLRGSLWTMALSGEGLFLGQVAPNVWHNPTTIFAMPFAVGSFWMSLVAMRKFTIVTAAALGVSLVLCLMAKPNYVLALAPCVVAALAAEPATLPDKFIRLFVAFVFPLVVLWGQAAVLVGPKGSTTEEMVFSPFEIWQRFSHNIPLSAFVGIVFPLVVLLVYRGRFAGEVALKLAWVALGLSVLEYAILKEGGTRGNDGNWGWGMMFADHVLFLASCEYLLRQRTHRRKVFCFGVFLAHVAFGGLYVALCMTDPKWAVFF